MTKAIDYGFLLLKNEGMPEPGRLPFDYNSRNDMVQKVADEFLNTCIPFLEQGQEDYIMNVFAHEGIDAGIIEIARSEAISRLLDIIGSGKAQRGR